MLSSFLDFFFKNCISFNSSHYKTLPFLPFEGNTFLFWCCVVIVFPMLPIVSYEQLRGIVSCMGILFILCASFYRIQWDYFRTFTSAIVSCNLQFNYSDLHAYMGLTFCLKFVLSVYNSKAIFTSFTMLLQSVGLILLPFVAEALLCFTFAACFHSLFLLSNKNNESVYFIFNVFLFQAFYRVKKIMFFYVNI